MSAEIHDEKHAARLAVALCEQLIETVQAYHKAVQDHVTPELERNYSELLAKVEMQLGDVRRALR